MDTSAPQELSLIVLRERYAWRQEKTAADIRHRVANALASIEPLDQRIKHEERFLWAMENGFIPAGRINHAAGTDRDATLINCFVQPVGDSLSGVSDGRCSIYDALNKAAETMRLGGGVGYNFSRIRPKGALIKSTGKLASGPIAWMKIFDKSCAALTSMDNRRGAQMGVLNVNHPDIQDFIQAKLEAGNLENFNLSIGVSDDFMHALGKGGTIDLVHGAEPGYDILQQGATRREDGVWVYARISARALWDKIMRASYQSGEPGVLFLDQITRENNLGYCEKIEATNPCGEQPLPDYGSCCLGSLNLTQFVDSPFTNKAAFDFRKMTKVVHCAVRMLDNVLDTSCWPLPQQRNEAMSKRRIGLGMTGLGDALLMLGLRYDCEAARFLAANIARTLRDVAYVTSIGLAREKGAFPLFDPNEYLHSCFAKRLTASLRTRIRRHGLRNSHLVSIAPAGTISMAFADNVSSGIEPAFSWRYHRKIRGENGKNRDFIVEDYGYRLFRSLGYDIKDLPEVFLSAFDIAPHDQLKMIGAIAPHVDAGISKTVNVPVNYPDEECQEIYREAWRMGLKGITAFRPNMVRCGILSASDDEASASRKSC